MKVKRSSPFEVVKKIISGALNQVGVFKTATTSLVDFGSLSAITVSVFFALAFLVCVNSPIKACSLPAIQPLSYFQNGQLIGRVPAINQIMNGLNKGVKFTSPVPADSKAIADNYAYQNTNNPQSGANKATICGIHPCAILLLFILCVISGTVGGYLITKSWFAYSPTIESIYNFICDVIRNIKKMKKLMMPWLLIAVFVIFILHCDKSFLFGYISSAESNPPFIPYIIQIINVPKEVKATTVSGRWDYNLSIGKKSLGMATTAVDSFFNKSLFSISQWNRDRQYISESI